MPFAEVCTKQIQEVVCDLLKTTVGTWHVPDLFHPVSEVTGLCWAHGISFFKVRPRQSEAFGCSDHLVSDEIFPRTDTVTGNISAKCFHKSRAFTC